MMQEGFFRWDGPGMVESALMYLWVSFVRAFVWLSSEHVFLQRGRPLLLAFVCLAVFADCGDGNQTKNECSLRRASAFNPNEKAFTSSALRWSCADTPTIAGVERGQEYCEYFALVSFPSEPAPRVVGGLDRIPRPSPPPGSTSCDLAEPVFITTPTAIKLSSAQRQFLESQGDAAVGQCIFTSWNEDIFRPLPGCSPNEDIPCPQVMGVDISAQIFRMKFTANSTEAAQNLLNDCAAAGTGEERQVTPAICPGGEPLPDLKTNDEIDDAFSRGCDLNAAVNETLHRKSDAILCSAAMRLGECGCRADNPDVSLANILSPYEKRGFPLGGWAGPKSLPPDCTYVDTNDESQTIVGCTLTGSDVLTANSDVKELCREKYADKIVVHVPIDDQAITCSNSSKSPFADNCSEIPWVLN